MKIIPSIDLQAGQCVRLKKGRFDQVTRYAEDPIKVAIQYKNEGAQTLHIVDLDGAKNQETSQLTLIAKIQQATELSIQVGGGIRTSSTVRQLLDAGIKKIVLGSIAITHVKLTQSMFNEFGADKFVLAFDVNIDNNKTPFVAIHGWQSKSDKTLWEAIDAFKIENISDILCTDIEKDGMLSGPNIALYRECIARYPSINFQASGGIHALDDLDQLSSNGLSSVIIGKALFEKKFTLTQAIERTEAALC